MYNHTNAWETIEFFLHMEYNNSNYEKGSDVTMNSFKSCDKQTLEKLYNQELSNLEACKEKGLKLDMSRGKPSKAQLDVAADILSVITKPEDCFDGNIDARNYGELAGLPCARAYWADVLGCKPEQTIVGGTASLNLMFDVIARAYSHGLLNSPKPWCKEETVKFLCPSPGYDRHFRITQFFGAELITISMTAEGPDMDQVEELVKDPAVKGIWCVPKYSNPDGIIYSDETIDRLAAMQTAAPDFTIMWDNAYCVHEFEGDFIPFRDMISVCAQAGNPNRVIEFASTSKITIAGGGISVIAASDENIKYLLKLMGNQIISYDKVNQLRHVRYLKDKAHTLEIMKEHAALMAPKFRVVLDMLEQEIAPLQIAQWNRPKGGYFVSFNAMPGTAKRTLQLCKEAGVTMTDAGATFPYGIDPRDSNIRIAPSLPPVEELKQAMEVFCICLKIATLEKLLSI